MVTATKKKLYLCSSCKKVGVKSKNSKVFETFFCPRCKKETTLFLPRENMEKEPEKDRAKFVDSPPPPPKYEIDVKTDVVTQIVRKRSFTIRDFFIFMIGFVTALIISKTR